MGGTGGTVRGNTKVEPELRGSTGRLVHLIPMRGRDGSKRRSFRPANIRIGASLANLAPKIPRSHWPRLS